MHSAYVLNEPGQPLYLQYRAAPLLRGKPADSVAWEAVDKWGKSAPVSRIDIDIECSPGYFFEESSPSFCAPCPAGSYNFPDAHDQVWKTALSCTHIVTRHHFPSWQRGGRLVLRRLLTPDYTCFADAMYSVSCGDILQCTRADSVRGLPSWIISGNFLLGIWLQ